MVVCLVATFASLLIPWPMAWVVAGVVAPWVLCAWWLLKAPHEERRTIGDGGPQRG